MTPLKEVKVMVWKRDLEKNKDISRQLTMLSRKIEEQEIACVYIPKKSYKLLTTLLESRYISYGIISSEELQG
ncbi:hypothetical protein Q0590_16855 [Rhodocytophaga aerolata]|uniref:Uncharacterized protein n=1 Tax=Rhodocytophaga aerolata TaxID=455078 RepID=A0ABT8R761_9BACT|nr:hypothetical protein [Rhodocytophaga aerolata]MDO1447944.1 hypothetical protein [Rhodocytophaga aerolata]